MEVRNNIFGFNTFKPVNSGIKKVFNNGISNDIFVRSTNSSNPSFKGNIRELLDKDYETLSKDEKNILRKEIDNYQKEVIDDCIKASTVLKAVYDDRYGENNWEYISIGRSCSMIAKCLAMMGVKTHIIPISGLQFGIEDGRELTKEEGFEKYRDFIYKSGLSPEEVESSGKTYIFQDYCDSGKSLRLFEQFIRSDEMGLNKDNITFESINEGLYDNIQKLQELGIENFNPFSFLSMRLGAQNLYGSLKTHTSTPKLHYKDIDKIDEVVKEPVRTIYKIFEFGMEDKIRNNMN